MIDGEMLPGHEIVRFPPDAIAAAIAFFAEHGYVVFRDAFPVAQGEAFWGEVEAALRDGVPLTFSHYGTLHTNPDVPQGAAKLPRIVDVESHLAGVVPLMLNGLVRDFLGAVYGGVAPTCLQTLTYKYSSEQGAHSDRSLVAPPYAAGYDRESLAASWFAIERSDERNGALVIYPGSHKVAKRSIHDGFLDDYGAFVQHCIDASAAAGCHPQAFRAEPGEVLFWHGDFVHAGGPIIAADERPTRRSLVCHYAAIPAGEPSGHPDWARIPYAGASYFAKRAAAAPEPAMAEALAG